LGNLPEIEVYTKSKKGSSWEMMRLLFQHRKEAIEINIDREKGEWLLKTLNSITIHNKNITIPLVKTTTFANIKADFELLFEDFELFWFSKPIKSLQEFGLLIM
jgi:hypothetical protein